MKYTNKVRIVCLMHIFTWPFAIISKMAVKLFSSERIFAFSTQLLSLVPGMTGQYLRASFYKQILHESDYDLAVGFCSFFAHPAASVGKGVVITSFSIIGTAIIENNVLISARVSILSGKYQHGKGFKEKSDDITRSEYIQVRIGENSWLGEGSIVMANVGKNCIVSAGSVVTKNMPDNMIAIGNPARFLKRGEV